MANKFLIKNTMADMRALSASEITALQNSTYDGVELLGYYEKGDTAAPIVYYLTPSNTDPGAENGGSIIEVGDIKLQHKFKGTTDVRYFGASLASLDNYTAIQKCLNYSKNVICSEIGEVAQLITKDVKSRIS